MSNLTVVTGIWDLKRDQAGDGFKRSFQHYIDRFIELMKTDVNMAIYIEKQYESLVWEHRQPNNTRVYIKEVESFKTNFDFFNKVQTIRTNPEWLNQAGWLSNSTQATLEYYNPMVMSKMFMLHDIVCFNPFGDDHYIWVDGGITSTVHAGYFTHDKILDKINPYLTDFFFVSFPYKNYEVHGFKKEAIDKYAGVEVDFVCRGGIFGGHRDAIRKANGTYYNLLTNTLGEGYMGTEESIFTIMACLDRRLYKRYMINADGLISTFAESLKNSVIVIEPSVLPSDNAVDLNNTTTALYVITFNSPQQFEALVESYLKHKKFITSTTNYLLDNSTDLTTTAHYAELCVKYNFEHIKKDNLGICGGRQFIAEHFADTPHDYYFFLEDDMLLKEPGSSPCSNGFIGYIPNLYDRVHEIIAKHSYDFVKLCFTEFYGSNNTQWAWYNVPQHVRDSVWPNNSKLPMHGIDPNSPRTKFNSINCIEGISYADGEVYYCNWPQLVSRIGNKKVFLDTKWAHPYEQTVMSHVFQLTLEGKIKPAILLASPINHHRFAHYAAGLRKES